MKSKLTSAAITVAMLATLHPANAQVRTADKPKSKFHLFSVAGFESIPEDPCIGRPGLPVTLRLGGLLAELAGNGKINRAATRKLSNGTDQLVDRLANTGNNLPTELDMELAEGTTKTGFVPNDYVMITVVLRVVRGVNFLRPLGANISNSLWAVTVDPNTKDFFCGRSVVNNYIRIIDFKPVRFQSVSFGVLKGTDVRSINIGIMIPDNVATPIYWMPIIIDPNVRNQG